METHIIGNQEEHLPQYFDIYYTEHNNDIQETEQTIDPPKRIYEMGRRSPGS